MSWEDDDEEVEDVGLWFGFGSTEFFSVVLSYLMPLVFVSIVAWMVISIFKKPPSVKEAAELEYKRAVRVASNAEEGGVFGKVAKTVRRALGGDEDHDEVVENVNIKAPLR